MGAFKMGAIHINLGRYFTPVTCFYVTRNSDENNLNLLFNHKQNYFRDSFFPRVVALWNNLNQDLKDSDRHLYLVSSENYTSISQTNL